MISPETIADIREKSDIVNIVSEYVQIRKRGKNYLGLCPFHAEKTPSFTVSPEKRLFHCFGCGEGGNIFAFIMKMENVDFAEAVEILANKLGIFIKRTGLDKPSQKSHKEELLSIINMALNYYKNNLKAHPEAMDYLIKRGLNNKTIEAFSLGFAPNEWSDLFKYLVQKGANPALIEKSGLTLKREESEGYYDRFRGRIIFPIFDLRGKAIAFGGRAYPEGSSETKYLNSPDSPVYNKSEVLYGLNFAREQIKKEGFAILVEGYMDLIALHQAGITNSIATCGTSMTSSQARVLQRFTEKLVLAFDLDNAGQIATERNAEVVRASGMEAKVAVLSGGKDPDEVIRKKGTKYLVNGIISALPYLEYKFGRVLSRYNIGEIEDKVRATREIADILAKERDQILIAEYTKVAAERLKINAENLASEIKRSNFYQKSGGAGKSLKRMTEKPPSKISVAEETLIRIALENHQLLGVLKEKLSLEGFSDAVHREIAELLYTVDVEKERNLEHFLLDNLPSEAAKKVLLKITMEEIPAQQNEKALFDCINTIKSQCLKDAIETVKNSLREAEKSGETAKAAELTVKLKDLNTDMRSFGIQ